MEDKLEQLIEQADTILISSHIGPDGDSVSSCLLLRSILAGAYPGKTVEVALEEDAPHLSFLSDYKQIKFGNLADQISQLKPTLFIILDANNLGRLTRDEGAARAQLAAIGAKIAIIDHHEPNDKDESDIYINNQSPAVVQDIYEIFFDKLGYKKPQDYAQTAILGLYTDTGGFIYRNLDYVKTFTIVGKLLADGANLEKVVNQLNRVSEDALAVVAELAKNANHIGNCTYSYISDDFIENYSGKSLNDGVRDGTDLFRHIYLRNIEGRPWGFIVYQDLLSQNRTYSVSFRALSDSIDVSEIARSLGGGGHKPAAGAKIEASSVDEALKQVISAVEKTASS